MLGGLPCPVSGPLHHRQRAWPASAEWSGSPERMLCCSGRWGYWCPGERQGQWEDGRKGCVSIQPQAGNASEVAATYCTSMISVWACLVQKAWGGVVQLTATKLVGLRSSAGVTSSLQAAGSFKHRRLQTGGEGLTVGCSIIRSNGRN